jgi:threonylcarbamoyladenosine tRNA methylthiotransferase MtaB
LSVEIITFGCRLNAADSQAIRTIAGDGDAVIVNSCAVTAEAVAEARKAIRRARRDRPDAPIFVTGCAAQIEPQSFAAMPEVTRVIGNREKFEAASFRADATARVRVSDIMAVRANAPHLVPAFADKVRAFVEVQTGCDHRCTFCIIPYGRGNSRSAPAGLVIDRIRALVDAGHQEVVLTGVDITSYGHDLPGTPSLGLLVERILRHVPDLPRLRLSSVDPIEIDARLIELIAHEPRVMPHLHLSLQAGDDMILKRMKRRHSRADAIALCQQLRAMRPGIAFGADLIAGFPTETDAMFANSLAIIDACDIVFGHIFPYSERAGTPAARMPQVSAAVRKARAAALRAAAGARHRRWLQSLVGTREQLLVERHDGSGHGRSFAPIRAPGVARRELVDVTISGVEDGRLIATPLPTARQNRMDHELA